MRLRFALLEFLCAIKLFENAKTRLRWIRLYKQYICFQNKTKNPLRKTATFAVLFFLLFVFTGRICIVARKSQINMHIAYTWLLLYISFVCNQNCYTRSVHCLFWYSNECENEIKYNDLSLNIELLQCVYDARQWTQIKRRIFAVNI